LLIFTASVFDMKKLLLVFACACCWSAASAQNIGATTAAQLFQSCASGDTTYIINFWATWCMPCVQELPEFSSLYEHYEGKPVKVILVSLDFKEDYPNKLAMFIQRKHLKPEVRWLSETDPNIFVPRVDEAWEGSIPATLIIKPGRFRKFIEGQMTMGQVVKIVDGIGN